MGPISLESIAGLPDAVGQFRTLSVGRVDCTDREACTFVRYRILSYACGPAPQEHGRGPVRRICCVCRPSTDDVVSNRGTMNSTPGSEEV